MLRQGVQVPVEVLQEREGTERSEWGRSSTRSPPHSARTSPRGSACPADQHRVVRLTSTLCLCVFEAFFRILSICWKETQEHCYRRGVPSPPRGPMRSGPGRAALPASPASSRRPLVPGSAYPGRASSPLPASCCSRSAPGSGPSPADRRRSAPSSRPRLSSRFPPAPPLTACRPPTPRRRPSAAAARAAPPRSPPCLGHRAPQRPLAAARGSARDHRCHGSVAPGPGAEVKTVTTPNRPAPTRTSTPTPTRRVPLRADRV